MQLARKKEPETILEVYQTFLRTADAMRRQPKADPTTGGQLLDRSGCLVRP